MHSAFALHLRNHPRFYSAALLGLLVWLGTAPFEPFMRVLLAGDAFFLTHLLAMAVLLSRQSSATYRRRAEQEDDGLPLIALITIVKSAVSLRMSRALRIGR